MRITCEDFKEDRRRSLTKYRDSSIAELVQIWSILNLNHVSEPEPAPGFFVL